MITTLAVLGVIVVVLDWLRKLIIGWHKPDKHEPKR
jgi:hypothetical protein